MSIVEIKFQCQKDYQTLDLKDLVERFIGCVDPKYLQGIKSIILLDDDIWKEEAWGRYVSISGTNFHDIHLYISNILKNGKKPLKNKLLLSYLIGHVIYHELGHHYKNLNKKRFYSFEKEQKEADMFGYNLLMKTLVRLFKYDVSLWMLKGRLYNLKMKKLFLSYISWYPNDTESGHNRDIFLGFTFISAGLLFFISLILVKHEFKFSFIIPILLGIAILFDWSGLWIGSLFLFSSLVYIIRDTKFFTSVNPDRYFGIIVSLFILFFAYDELKYYFKFFRKLKFRKEEIAID